jgi:uroporphyrinogen decarboxylase
MSAAGCDVVGIDWRIALDDAWSRIGDRGIQGNLDPAALLGGFDVAASAARDVLARAAGRGGHVFNLGHGVLPDTDPDDLARLADLVHRETSR